MSISAFAGGMQYWKTSPSLSLSPYVTTCYIGTCFSLHLTITIFICPSIHHLICLSILFVQLTFSPSSQFLSFSSSFPFVSIILILLQFIYGFIFNCSLSTPPSFPGLFYPFVYLTKLYPFSPILLSFFKSFYPHLFTVSCHISVHLSLLSLFPLYCLTTYQNIPPFLCFLIIAKLSSLLCFPFRICLPQISLKIIILNKPPPLLSVFPFFSILTFCLFQCLTHELVSPPTEAITGQLAGRQGGSNSLTLGGLINLRITVVRQWKERYREDLGMEKEKKCMFNGG